MAIPATFSVHRNKAYAGMQSDLSLYNVDGACAAEGTIPVGVAVFVSESDPVDGYKTVKQISASQPPYGITKHSHAYSPEFKYEDGSAVNVLTHGRIWVKSKDKTAPTFDSTVNFDSDGHHKQTGDIVTLWTFAGGFLPDPFSAGNFIIEIQVKQSAVQNAVVAP